MVKCEMQCPQKENGYTAIANEIMDALCKYNIPGENYRVLMSVLRMTYGWNRKEATLSNNQIAKMTGLKRQNVVRAIRWLESKMILSRIKDDSTGAKVLKFNKHYDEWTPYVKKQGRIKDDSKTRIKDDSKSTSLPIIVKTNKTSRVPYQEIISYLNQKCSKNFRSNSKTTQKHIQARWNEGFILTDFKKVVDIKSSKWLKDPKMVDYLRPETLFGTKFESYLNEKSEINPKSHITTDEELEALNA